MIMWATLAAGSADDSPAELAGSVPGLAEVAEVSWTTLRRLASTELSLDDLLDVLGAIRAHPSAGADGVVVAQGTDTLEETAFALDLLWDTRRQAELPAEKALDFRRLERLRRSDGA